MPHVPAPDAFAVFGVPRTLDLDAADLELRYLKLSRECHPDRGGSTRAQQEREHAYAALLKAAHDERWGTSASAIGAHSAVPLKLLTDE